VHGELEKFIPDQYNIDLIDGATMRHEDTVTHNDKGGEGGVKGGEEMTDL
jgi:hypothetical protein